MPDAVSRNLSPVERSRVELRSLTSLRFLAATIVVVYHYGQAAVHSPWVGNFFFDSGSQAVLFFFVLSGFILTYVYAFDDARPVDKRQFWFARIARIGPVYWIALLLALPQLFDTTFRVHSNTVSQSLGALICTPLLVQSWIPPLATVWNSPAWSLSVEAFFYLLFPYLVARLHVISTRNLLVWSLAVAVCAGAARNLATEACVNSCSQALRDFIKYFPLFHLPEFIVGIAIARLFLQGPRISVLLAESGFIAACLIVGLIWWAGPAIPSVLASEAVLVPLYALMIYSAAIATGPISRSLSHKWLVLLGDISYGVYILHVPLYFLWMKGFRYVTGRQLPHTWTFWQFFVFLILVSLLVYYKVERPCRAAFRRWVRAEPHLETLSVGMR